MSNFTKLTFADLKAVGEYIANLKSERTVDLKSQRVNIKEDERLKELDKLEFKFHIHLNSKIY